jgi:predicted ATPase
MAPRWRLRVLGDCALVDAQGVAQPLAGRLAWLLLARLALAPQQTHPREVLVELLWPGVAAAVARNRLRQLLATLRGVLEPAGQPSAPVLLADRQSLRLVAAALACDATAFEAAVQAGRWADAAALYGGELLPGHYDDWSAQERHRLAALAERLPASGTAVAGVAVPAVPALADRPPSGAAPTDLAAPADPATPAPLRAVPRHTLPHYLTPLCGIDAPASQLRQAVVAHRLVSVLGPGGLGKTRLAVEVARELAATPAEGAFDLVVFVPLAACSRADAVPDALWLALRGGGEGVAPGPPGAALPRLRALLAGRRALLLLDNLEQLLPALQPLLAELLASCPSLHLLVTSRRALGLDGERQVRLAPLPVPVDVAEAGADSDALADDRIALNPAIALFLDRARAARADFRLSPRNRAAVVALVQRLGGMPLAIELAAARVRSLSPAALLALLQADGGAASLALLARSGPRAGADQRHASMLAVVQWSWQLLSLPAQLLLARLSVFDGGCTLAAVQAVCSGGPVAAPAVVDLLDSLVADSLLRVDGDDLRYQPYELIRSHAAAQLPPDDARALRERHRRWWTATLQAWPVDAPLQALRPELPNVVAALLSAQADGQWADAADLVQALQRPLGGLSLPPQVLAALQHGAGQLPPGASRGALRANLARMLLNAGQIDAAQALAQQALPELPASGLARATALSRLAHVARRAAQDPAAVAAWLDEALPLAQAAGDAALQANILTNQGAACRRRDPQRAAALQRQAIALWRAAGDVHGVDVGRCNLALALMATPAGHAEALALLDDALRSSAAQGDDTQLAQAWNLRGEVMVLQRRWAEAAAAYQACVRTAFAAAEPWPLAYGLWNLPRALARQRQPELAAWLMGLAERHVPTVTGPLVASDARDLQRVRLLAARQCGAAAVARAWAAGATATLHEAIRRLPG